MKRHVKSPLIKRLFTFHLNHEETADKFEGDAIIAFFGAPDEIKNHAEVACLSCAAMQKRMAELRQNENAAPGQKMPFPDGHQADCK